MTSPVPEFSIHLQGSPLDRPTWFVLETRTQCEASATQWLRRHRIEAFYPVEKVWRKRLGKGFRQVREEVERTIAPGYVFARFEGTPLWHRIFGYSLGAMYLRGVVSMNGAPAAIANSAVLQMAHLPERLQEAREAEKRRLRVSGGDRAQVVAGPLEGWVVDVKWVDKDVARILVPLLGKGEATVEVSHLEKILGGGQ